MSRIASGAFEDAWYPLGSPVDIRRHGIAQTWLMGRQIDLEVHRTWISPSVGGRALPVTERLGLVWTTLGRPNGPPQQLIEYYEVDRTTLNVSSAPIEVAGSAVVEDAVGRLGDLSVEASIDRDEHGAFRVVTDRADLGVLGSGIACEVRAATPFSAVFTFRHPSRTPGQEHRKDIFAVFCQPMDVGLTIAHRLAAIVDLPASELEIIRSGNPFVSRRVGAAPGPAAATRAFRDWVDEIGPDAIGVG